MRTHLRPGFDAFHLPSFSFARVVARWAGVLRYAVLLLLGAGSAEAQSSVRGWGTQVFDSAWHDARDFVEVAAGWGHTLARRANGSVVAWGANFAGQCNVPALPAGLTYVEVAAGWGHTLARRSDGSVVAWGSNQNGQCNVPALPPGSTYVEIAAGYYHSVARRSDGSVVAWGNGGAGQTTVPALPGGLTYVEIAAGWQHTVARRSDGSVVAWGHNGYGQSSMGAGSGAPGPFVEIAAGSQDTLARRADNSVVVWGANDYGLWDITTLPPGQCLGIAVGNQHSWALLANGQISAFGKIVPDAIQAGTYVRWIPEMPPAPPGTSYVQVVSGESHAVALRSDGAVIATGWNWSGQTNIPWLPSGMTYVQVAVGEKHALALRSDGALIGWGEAGYGSGQSLPPPIPLPAGVSYVKVGAGEGHSVALQSDGNIVAWGWNGSGQTMVPALPAGLAYVDIAVGPRHNLALRSDGTLVVWGIFGQSSVPPLPSGITYVGMAAGWEHSLARRSDGTIVQWGYYGVTGVPALPAGITYVGIAAGESHSMALRSDGLVSVWGTNGYGEGNVPALPSGMTYVQVAAGARHSLARRSDGTVLAWGYNSHGQTTVPPVPSGFENLDVTAAFHRSAVILGRGVSVDSVAPEVVISQPVDGAVVGTGLVDVVASVADESSTTVASMPAGLVATLPAGGGAVQGVVTVGTDGPHVLTVRATDAAGNVGGASVAIVRDTTTPLVGIVAPAVDGAVLGTTTTDFVVQVADLTATQVSIGNDVLLLPPGGGTANGTVSLVEGTQWVSVTVVDAAGNVTVAQRQIVVDLTLPVVTILSPANGASFGPGSATIPVLARVDDATATMVTSDPSGVAGALPSGGGLVAGSATLVEGLNTLAVMATDATNRQGVATVTVVLDTTAPDVAIVSPANLAAVRGVVDVAVQADDAAPGSGVADVRLYLDGAALPWATLAAAPYEASLDTAMLPDGLHTLVATASDGQGNARTCSPLTIRVDNTPPVVVFVSPAAGATVAGVLDILIHAGDPGAGVVTAVVTVAGATPNLVDPSFRQSSPQAIVDLLARQDTAAGGDGPLNLAVSAVDAAGNETTASLAVVINNSSPPVCTLTPAGGSVVGGVIPIVAAVTSGSFTQIEIRVDGVSLGNSAASPLSIPFDTRNRLDGDMRVTAVVTYGANQSVDVSSVVTVDNISFDLNPGVLNLKGSGGNGAITAILEGVSVGLLMPVELHGLVLRVAGGGSVVASSGWGGDDHTSDTDADLVPELRVRFERRALANAIQAAVSGGGPGPGGLVRVELWAEASATQAGFLVGATSLKVVGQ